MLPRVRRCCCCCWSCCAESILHVKCNTHFRIQFLNNKETSQLTSAVVAAGAAARPVLGPVVGHRAMIDSRRHCAGQSSCAMCQPLMVRPPRYWSDPTFRLGRLARNWVRLRQVWLVYCRQKLMNCWLLLLLGHHCCCPDDCLAYWRGRFWFWSSFDPVKSWGLG